MYLSILPLRTAAATTTSRRRPRASRRSRALSSLRRLAHSSRTDAGRRPWHRDHADAVAEFFRGGESVLQFTSTRHDDEVELAFFFFCNVTAAQNAFASCLNIDIVQYWNDLSRQRDQSGPVCTLNSGDKRTGGFFRIGGTNYVDVWHQTN